MLNLILRNELHFRLLRSEFVAREKRTLLQSAEDVLPMVGVVRILALHRRESLFEIFRIGWIDLHWSRRPTDEAESVVLSIREIVGDDMAGNRDHAENLLHGSSLGY